MAIALGAICFEENKIWEVLGRGRGDEGNGGWVVAENEGGESNFADRMNGPVGTEITRMTSFSFFVGRQRLGERGDGGGGGFII